MQKLAPASSNHLLSSLKRGDFDLLRPHLEAATLPVRQVIEAPDQKITHVFFPTSGVISVVAVAPEYQIEVGIIGREGMTGLSVLLGAATSPHRCFVQVAAESLRISTAKLRELIDARPTIHAHLLTYARSFMLQTAQTALANGKCTIEERLARWLLMCDDRLDGDIPLTHEFLSLMLGVRRPGVTLALETLEGANVIRNTRACIAIRDREKLTEIAGGAYTPL